MDGSSNAMPKQRQSMLKWNGWGFNDSQFVVHKDPHSSNHCVTFTGDRYKIGGGMELPHFVAWVISTLGVDFNVSNPARPPPAESEYPEPVPNPALAAALTKLAIPHSYAGSDRLFRAHGHTLAEIYCLRNSPRQKVFPRIPDLVVWPGSHAEVEAVMEVVEKCGAALMVFGGGTSVTGALLVPETELRTVVVLDTSQMCKILNVDKHNLTACVECGITGLKLEEELEKMGYTTGHQPDSYEFSSVGGWVATRASGMKKNVYGNIEDLLVAVEMVTPRGCVSKLTNKAPRISAGPDINHIVLGSEGTLGVVTRVTLKVRPMPVRRVYGSVVFPDLSAGIAWLREVAARRCQPASIRLMDNSQFKFGHALKPKSSLFGLLSDGIKKAYLTRVKGFNLDTMCVATLLFEGSVEDVAQQERLVNTLATQHGGMPAGEANGERGYMLTFVIAYIRDLGMNYGIVAESFETSMPWDCVEKLCTRVKKRVHIDCDNHGIQHRFVTCRVTQTYDAGACVYFYFAFNYVGLHADPVHIYEEIENGAREEILQCGGSISHHHGVGKIRRQFMCRTLSPPSLGVLEAIKHYLDPNNTMASDNLLPPTRPKL